MANKNSGFSLIEVLLSFSLLSIIGLGFLTFSDSQNKILKSTDSSFEVLDFVGQSRLLLSEWRACSGTLTNIPLHSSTPVAISVIKGSAPVPNTNPTAWTVFDYKLVGVPISPSNSVQLTSAQILYPPTYNGQVELEMTFTKTFASPLGGAKMVRKFPISVFASTSNPSLIGRCYTSGALVNSEATMCMNLGGHYDLTTQTCKGLFDITIEMSTIPNHDHYERLELNNGILKVIVM